jgi:hypothetical protein
LELENQFGQKIRLSPEDEKALKIGMTLHEKGKALLQKSDYKSALELFKGSDASFSQW